MFIPTGRQFSSLPHSHQTRDLTKRDKTHIAYAIGLVLGVAAFLACIIFLIYRLRRRWAQLEEEKARTHCEGSRTTKEDMESRRREMAGQVVPFSGFSGRSIMARIASIRLKRGSLRGWSKGYSSIQQSPPPSLGLPVVPTAPVDVQVLDPDVPPPIPPKPPGLVAAQRALSTIGPLPTIQTRSQQAYGQRPAQPRRTLSSPATSSAPIPIAELRRAGSQPSFGPEQQNHRHPVTGRTIRPEHIATCYNPHQSPATPPTKPSIVSPSRTLRSTTNMVTYMELLQESDTPREGSPIISPMNMAPIIISPLAELAPSTPRTAPPHLTLPPQPRPKPRLDIDIGMSPTLGCLLDGNEDTETKYSSDGDEDNEASTFNSKMSVVKVNRSTTTSNKSITYLFPPRLPPLSPQMTGFSFSTSETTTLDSRPSTGWYDVKAGIRSMIFVKHSPVMS